MGDAHVQLPGYKRPDKANHELVPTVGMAWSGSLRRVRVAAFRGNRGEKEG